MRMEKMWKEMDTNEDGSITREESTAFGNKKFDERDSNKDGKVTREEWDAFRKAKMEERKKRMNEKQANMPKDGASTPAPAEKK
jgi:Ca2+-binding EF-hand superfamily protein